MKEYTCFRDRLPVWTGLGGCGEQRPRPWSLPWAARRAGLPMKGGGAAAAALTAVVCSGYNGPFALSQHSMCSPWGRLPGDPLLPLRAVGAAYHRRNLWSGLYLLPETLWCLLLLGRVFHTSVTAAPQGICGWEYIAPVLPGGSVDPFLGREGCQKTVLLEEQA